MTRVFALATLLAGGAGCGYRISGHADLIPKSIKTIAIPAFANQTTRYRLDDRITAALVREFISRTRYQVVADPRDADAVLSGNVLNAVSYPTVFDPVSGRASGVQIIVSLQATLTERATGKVLFTRPSMDIRERYEISVDQRAFFDESDPAIERLSRDVARSLVSAILENF